MKRLLSTVAAIAFFASLADAQHADRKLVLTHYMPWYSAKPFSSHWGWHWTMNRFQPDKVGKDGRRDAASHDRPLIDLYDSGDPDALTCQALQMKFAGIDGVIIDWYGIESFNDYSVIHRNTRTLIPILKRAGLRFAVCYEDQSIKHMVNGGKLSADASVNHGRSVMKWLDENWFSDDAYVRIDGRPLLLVFGPQHFDGPQWNSVTSAAASRPLVHTLPHLAKKFQAAGPFGWPPVTGGKNVSPEKWRDYLARLHARSGTGESVISVAFPGFHDIYQEAGLHDSYGHIDHRDGKTFTETLDLTLTSDAKVIQIATWNDYGEGTVIEPSRNHGYRYLEELQRRRRSPFSPDDLRLPTRLYKLRQQHAVNRRAQEQLDEATELLFAAKCDEARALLEALSRPDR